MKIPDSVRSQVTWLLLGMVVLVAVVAGAGAAGVASLTRDVEVVVGSLRPAASTTIALRNDMDLARADARRWARTRDWKYLEEYDRAVTDARRESERLESVTAEDARLNAYALEQSAAVAAWTALTETWLERQAGRSRTASLPRGDARFERFVELNHAMSVEVNRRIGRHGEQARDRGGAIIWFVLLVSVSGLAMTIVIGRAMVRQVSGPLREMEDGVERLAAGDLSARVSTKGPREIRGVSSALNVLAEENQRAREMEEQVVRQLRRLDRAKDEFVSTVSHELRTPLTSIAGYIELFEDGFGEELTPQQRGMLGVIRRNVVRLRSLIEDLLTLSSVEADAFRTSFEVVDLDLLTVDAAREVSQLAARAGVQVQVSTPRQPTLVRGDAGQLSRATLNLLSNAVKFSSRGGAVVIGLARKDGQAVVSVVDRGIGIPAEELPTLGTRFFRASNAVASEITGTGLGLKIVQTIAHNHGGRLELESEEGTGTVARLVVPLSEPAASGNTRRLQEITKG